MKIKKRYLPLWLLLLAACQNNRKIIQQSARNLASQSPHIENLPPANPSPWIPFLIGIVIILATLATVIIILFYRATLKATQEHQQATIQVQRKQLRAERKLLQQMLLPQTPPQGSPQPPYQHPKEPPRQW